MTLNEVQKLADDIATEYGIAPLTVSHLYGDKGTFSVSQRDGSKKLQLLLVTQELLDDAMYPEEAFTSALALQVQRHEGLLIKAVTA